MQEKPPVRMLQQDEAPVDYQYVPSVSEGRRREQEQKIHREPFAPVVRHRAEPENHGTLVGYGRRAVSDSPRGRESIPDHLPSMQDGPTPAQSVALPEDYGIPDNPFDPPAETQQPRRRSRVQSMPEPQAVPQPQAAPAFPPAPVMPANATSVLSPGTGARTAMPVMTAEDGSQFQAPGHADVPDWLRVAQQNNMPLHRPHAPRVQAAPRQTEDAVMTDALGRPLRNRHHIAQAAVSRQPASVSSQYAEAGYPEELLSAQRRMEAEDAARPVRRRHGAQYAVAPVYEQERMQPSAARPSSYPQPRQQYQQSAPQPMPEETMARGYHRPRPAQPEAYQVENEEYEEQRSEAAGILARIPWLGIAAFVSVLCAVVLWIMQSTYQGQTQQVLDERAAQELSIRQSHPLPTEYQALIYEKAVKYNLDPAFVAAIMLNESSFRPEATAASTGARGLMQMMDETAEWIYGKLDMTGGYDFDDMYNPQINAEFGCWYLNYLSGQFYGDPILVAAAFHAGQGEVRNWLNTSEYSRDGRSIRLEEMIDGRTKQYVRRVLDDFAAYKRLYYGG